MATSAADRAPARERPEIGSSARPPLTPYPFEPTLAPSPRGDRKRLDVRHTLALAGAVAACVMIGSLLVFRGFDDTAAPIAPKVSAHDACREPDSTAQPTDAERVQEVESPADARPPQRRRRALSAAQLRQIRERNRARRRARIRARWLARHGRGR